MIESLLNEEWRTITIEHALKKNYAVSNYGRMVSYTADDLSDAVLLKNATVQGYPCWRYTVPLAQNKSKKRKTVGILVHKLVAMYFLPNSNPDRKYVIHLDFNKTNNKASNLKWATAKEMSDHNYESATYRESRKALKEYQKMPKDGRKLTLAQAKLLKKKIMDPNRKTRYKMLAKQFGVSEMAIYRMKRGENWDKI
ncbi:MAG: HNH endonuclease [Luteibaculaceae bacterium]